jgi:endonuclease YncB( thermonuclease family)
MPFGDLAERYRVTPRPLLAAANAVVAVIALCALAASITVSAQVRALVGTRFDVRVVSIVDGDTFDAVPLDSTTGRIRIRLHGIDTPERGEPFSSAATKAARVLLFDQRATVEGRDVDRYGRLVARVTVQGADVRVTLVEEGLACHWVKYSREAVLATAEATARAQGRGFWAAGAQRPRCTTASARATVHSSASEGQVVFHGNTSSHVYHAPFCPNYTCKNCTRPFHSEAEAQAAGFRPAGDCIGRARSGDK